MAATPTPSASPTPAASTDPSAPVPDDAAVQADIARSTVLARELGKRVEVLSERTESSTTWANVNGSFTTSTFDGPVRIKDAAAADGWRDLDYDLVKQEDGSFAPKSGYVPLELSGATTAAESEGNPVVSLTGRDSTDLGFGWDGALPEPTIDGDKATYSNVQPNVDLVVQLTAKGFEQSFLLKSKPAAGTDTSLELPLIADGVDATEGSTGAVALTDSDHKSVGTIPTPYMWDSTGANGSAEPNTAKLPVAVVDQADGTQTLVLTPTQSFLNDPDTKYPVIIDPVIQPYNPAFDTYVQSNMTTTNFSTSTELHVGVQTDGGAVTRSFLNFDAREFLASSVTSALLTLYQTQSTTCTATPMTVTASELANANTRWPAQPGNNASQTATISASKGYSTACPAGSYRIDVTGLTNFLASQNTPTIGMRLTASETLRSGWKNINSADNTAHKPNLEVTYNRYPHDADKPTVSPVAVHNGAAYATSTTPTFSSSAVDPDGSNTLVRYEVYRTTTITPANLVGGCDSGGVASGAAATCIFHNTFPASDTYYVRALGQDGSLWSKTWSDLTAFNVGIDAPPVPVVSCETADGDPTNANNATIPAPSEPVQCTVTASSLGKSSAAVNVRSRLDSGAVTSLDVEPGIGGTIKVSVPNTNGTHTIATSATNSMGITSSIGYKLTFADVTPATPTISCLAPFINGYMATSVPATPVNCTVSVSNETFDASNGSLDVYLDGEALGSTKFTNTATTTVTVPVPPLSGVHKIVASATSSWGGISGESAYGFAIPGPSVPLDFSATPWVPISSLEDPNGVSATSFTPTLSSTSNDSLPEITTFEIRSAQDTSSSSLVQTCTSLSIPTGGIATCKLAPLVEGNYFVRSRAADSSSTSGWSDWSDLPVSAIANAAVLSPATVSCPGIVKGQWVLQALTAPVTCVVIAPAAPSGSGSLDITLDGQALPTIPLATNSTVSQPVTIPAGAGEHAIETSVQGVINGPFSPSDSFYFGSGNWADANLVPNISNGANSEDLGPSLWVDSDGAPFPVGVTVVYSLSSDVSGANPILTSPASPHPLEIPDGTLTEGVTYYWNAQIQGPQNVGGGTSQLTSPWWSFVATAPPQEPASNSSQRSTASSAAAAVCPGVTLITVRGTGAPGGKVDPNDKYIYLSSGQTTVPKKTDGYGNPADPEFGLVRDIRKKTSITFPVFAEALNYDAKWWPIGVDAVGYFNSVEGGRDHLTKELNVVAKKCPSTLIWLSGHSQGAQVIGEVLAKHPDKLSGQVLKSLRGVVITGDPTYHENEAIDASGNGKYPGLFPRLRKTGSYNKYKAKIPGSKGDPLIFVRSYCKPRDFFCQGTATSGDTLTIHNSYGEPETTKRLMEFLRKFITGS